MRKATLFLSHVEYAELWEWSTLCADTLRVIARRNDEAIQTNTFHLDCFVPRNDAKRREIDTDRFCDFCVKYYLRGIRN